MKYPRIHEGDIVLVDEVPYMCITGIKEGQKVAYGAVYNVQLRSVSYHPEKHKEYIRCKNIDLPPYTKL